MYYLLLIMWPWANQIVWIQSPDCTLNVLLHISQLWSHSASRITVIKPLYHTWRWICNIKHKGGLNNCQGCLIMHKLYTKCDINITKCAPSAVWATQPQLSSAISHVRHDWSTLSGFKYNAQATYECWALANSCILCMLYEPYWTAAQLWIMEWAVPLNLPMLIL